MTTDKELDEIMQLAGIEPDFIVVISGKDIESPNKTLLESIIKMDGVQWKFNAFDADGWPSNPHGHFKNTKLNPYDGTIFNVTNKQEIGRLNKKALADLQAQLKSKKDFRWVKF